MSKRPSDEVLIALGASVELMETLRSRCPWDSKQTHGSLRKYLLEESYEVVDVIDRLDGYLAEVGADDYDESQLDNLYSELEEELGDLWFQVLFHTKLASEQNRFDVGDVASRLRVKMVARHPHVFEPGMAGVIPTVDRWEKIKQEEKNRDSIFDDIPLALPALMRAEKVVKRAKRSGFPVEKPGSQADGQSSPVVDSEQFGQALLALVIEAVEHGVSPELALRSALEAAVERGRAAEAEQNVEASWLFD